MTKGYKTLVDDALDRMKRAYERGTGCHLTAEMIQAMGVSIFGDIWSEPRDEGPHHD